MDVKENPQLIMEILVTAQAHAKRTSGSKRDNLPPDQRDLPLKLEQLVNSKVDPYQHYRLLGDELGEGYGPFVASQCAQVLILRLCLFVQWRRYRIIG